MSDTEDSELDELRKERMEQLKEEAEAPDTPEEPIKLGSSEDFDAAVSEHQVTLVDFYADWCGPCKMLTPVLQTIARETDAAVLKVDIDAHQGLAQGMGIRSVPTLHLYSGGEQVEQLVGVQDEETLRKLIEQHG